MTQLDPSWMDALDSRGRIPFPRLAVPIVLPFPGTADAFEAGVNDRHEAMMLDVLATDPVQMLLVMVGPLLAVGQGFPPEPLRRKGR